MRRLPGKGTFVSSSNAMSQTKLPVGGKEKITIHSVAAAAGVSVGTVSRVMNNNVRVAADIRLRVLEAVERLGYVPNAVAQSMRTQTTKMIGCIVSDIANQLFAKSIGAAEGVLRKAGYVLVLAASHGSTLREIELLTTFARRRLEGCIVSVSDETDPRILSLLQSLPTPIVLLERSVSLEIDRVNTNHFSGLYQAVSYLLALGHRRIGLITVPRTALAGRERAAAFRKAHEDFGLSANEEFTAFGGYSLEYGYKTTRTFLCAPLPPTAIIAGANEITGVIHAARSMNRAIPDDLSLISLGDTDLAQIHSPPISAVRWNNVRTGELAAEMLLSRIAFPQKRETHKIVLEAEFVLRESCSAPQA